MKTYLITGACGFVGSNAVLRYTKQGHTVIGVDNLSRNGTEENYKYLRNHTNSGLFIFKKRDITDSKAIDRLFKKYTPDRVIHLAAQVAVTTSVEDPRRDMEDNIIGTFNILEAVRKNCGNAEVVYASTNKVYGKLEELKIRKLQNRYEYFKKSGAEEMNQLDGYSPYGVSKLAGDQYMRDYARIYGLKTVVFRQSCIAGPMQQGTSDQGWTAWFTIAAQTKQPITIYGDGMQTRDVLHVQDLLDAYDKAFENMDKIRGQIYNMGGGYENSISLLQLIEWLEKRCGYKLDVSYDDWRPGDQKVFVANTKKFEEETGWGTKRTVWNTLEDLYNWAKARN